MNVYFPSAETDSAKQSINVDRATTAYRTSTRNAERAGRSSFALDISGTVTDNSAYAGHGTNRRRGYADGGTRGYQGSS